LGEGVSDNKAAQHEASTSGGGHKPCAMCGFRALESCDNEHVQVVQ
jgi:hypothetical protein